MEDLYSIDISKCLQIDSIKEITGILKSVSINRKTVKMWSRRRLEKGKTPSLFYLKSQNSFDFLCLEINKIDQSLNLIANPELEILIESESIVYFFPSEVIKVKEAELTITFPKALYKINRSESFRYSPSAEAPVAIEFCRSNILYKYYVFDISMGGLSVIIPEGVDSIFINDPLISGVKIIFSHETIDGISLKQAHFGTRILFGQKFNLYGMKYIGIKTSKQEQIGKNIVLEQKELLELIRKKLF